MDALVDVTSSVCVCVYMYAWGGGMSHTLDMLFSWLVCLLFNVCFEAGATEIDLKFKKKVFFFFFRFYFACLAPSAWRCCC